MVSLRTDIQVLRGLAILLVLLYHAGIGVFPAGYLGVDIFFVISGFLITGLIRTRVEKGTFRFQEFYVRRAKRLLPAAYTTFLAVALLAPLALTSREFADFQKQLIGAVTLTGNIVLWGQTGYFEGAAELKPLLHVWSLAIEEQYYLLMPAALVLVPSRFWRPGIVLVCALSLAACLILGPLKPGGTFYLLPTRAWELGAGSIGALWLWGPNARRVIAVLFWPAMLVLLAVPAVAQQKGPPGWLTVLVCAATLAVILRGHPVFRASPLWDPMVRLGNMSYSLYLVHWPIFAFLNNCWIGDIPYWVKIAAAGLSVAVAWCLYTVIEKPIHYADLGGSPARPWLLASNGTLSIIAVAVWMPHSSHSTTDYAYIRRVNVGFAEACEYTADFTPKPECRNSDHPSMLVWGDSFGMHLVAGLAENNGSAGTIQATRSLCGPLLGMAPLFRPEDEEFPKGYNREWSENCIAFNASVLDYLARTPSIKFVVLSSPFVQYLNGPNAVLERTAEGFVERRPVVETLADGVKRTVDAVRSAGKRVVVIAPPPAAGFDIGICLERLVTGKVSLGHFSDCSVPVEVFHERYRPVRTLLDLLPREAGVDVIRFDDYLCGPDFCKTLEGDTFLYRDKGHLSYDGSRLLARQMGLAHLVQATAR